MMIIVLRCDAVYSLYGFVRFAELFHHFLVLNYFLQ